ncbi:unnamed protein product [Amoebophrya sp. A25]|nr:unnamed protein product [Amoebophrya sp. A25]|eukprot:GSA25T00026720001.1
MLHVLFYMDHDETSRIRDSLSAQERQWMLQLTCGGAASRRRIKASNAVISLGQLYQAILSVCERHKLGPAVEFYLAFMVPTEYVLPIVASFGKHFDRILQESTLQQSTDAADMIPISQKRDAVASIICQRLFRAQLPTLKNANASTSTSSSTSCSSRVESHFGMLHSLAGAAPKGGNTAGGGGSTPGNDIILGSDPMKAVVQLDESGREVDAYRIPLRLSAEEFITLIPEDRQQRYLADVVNARERFFSPASVAASGVPVETAGTRVLKHQMLGIERWRKGSSITPQERAKYRSQLQQLGERERVGNSSMMSSSAVTHLNPTLVAPAAFWTHIERVHQTAAQPKRLPLLKRKDNKTSVGSSNNHIKTGASTTSTAKATATGNIPPNTLDRSSSGAAGGAGGPQGRSAIHMTSSSTIQGTSVKELSAGNTSGAAPPGSTTTSAASLPRDAASSSGEERQEAEASEQRGGPRPLLEVQELLQGNKTDTKTSGILPPPSARSASASPTSEQEGTNRKLTGPGVPSPSEHVNASGHGTTGSASTSADTGQWVSKHTLPFEQMIFPERDTTPSTVAYGDEEADLRLRKCRPLSEWNLLCQRNSRLRLFGRVLRICGGRNGQVLCFCISQSLFEGHLFAALARWRSIKELCSADHNSVDLSRNLRSGPFVHTDEEPILAKWLLERISAVGKLVAFSVAEDRKTEGKFYAEDVVFLDPENYTDLPTLKTSAWEQRLKCDPLPAQEEEHVVDVALHDHISDGAVAEHEERGGASPYYRKGEKPSSAIHHQKGPLLSKDSGASTGGKNKEGAKGKAPGGKNWKGSPASGSPPSGSPPSGSSSENWNDVGVIPSFSPIQTPLQSASIPHQQHEDTPHQVFDEGEGRVHKGAAAAVGVDPLISLDIMMNSNDGPAAPGKIPQMHSHPDHSDFRSLDDWAAECAANYNLRLRGSLVRFRDTQGYGFLRSSHFDGTLYAALTRFWAIKTIHAWRCKGVVDTGSTFLTKEEEPDIGRWLTSQLDHAPLSVKFRVEKDRNLVGKFFANQIEFLDASLSLEDALTAGGTQPRAELQGKGAGVLSIPSSSFDADQGGKSSASTSKNFSGGGPRGKHHQERVNQHGGRASSSDHHGGSNYKGGSASGASSSKGQHSHERSKGPFAEASCNKGKNTSTTSNSKSKSNQHRGKQGYHTSNAGYHDNANSSYDHTNSREARHHDSGFNYEHQNVNDVAGSGSSSVRHKGSRKPGKSFDGVVRHDHDQRNWNAGPATHKGGSSSTTHKGKAGKQHHPSTSSTSGKNHKKGKSSSGFVAGSRPPYSGGASDHPYSSGQGINHAPKRRRVDEKGGGQGLGASSLLDNMDETTRRALEIGLSIMKGGPQRQY